jgi:ankyrin repeat protein
MNESEKERNERESRYEPVIRLLLAAGADQTVRDDNGMTAYEVALKNENSKAAKILKP